MSRPVKNARTGKTPGGPHIPNPKGKQGAPDKHSGRENLGAGGYVKGGKMEPMFEGKAQILKDNRRS